MAKRDGFEQVRISGNFEGRWRLFVITVTERPHGWRQWRNFLWGFDLWLGPIPFLRTTVLLDAILVWALR